MLSRIAMAEQIKTVHARLLLEGGDLTAEDGLNGVFS
jgi:hypothetical protein